MAHLRASRYGSEAGVPETDHYSYSMYADAAMAERFDALRFSGPIGTIVAGAQEEAVVSFLSPLEGRRILDVGTGTGRAAIALARRGAQVTGVDASQEMLQVAERRALDAGVHVSFVRGDVHHLQFADRSVDDVVCLRVLMHTPDWRRSLAELCRVADRRIVIDYPSRRSFAAVQSLARKAASRFVSGVEAYRVMSPRAISAALEACGFRVVQQHRLFVLPIAFHKKIGSARFTRAVEASLARLGLLRAFGSPITFVAERCA